ncbi:MAG: site-specific integrase [Pirellulales bacterium]
MTRGHYVRAVRWVSEALGRDATLADLNDETLVFLLAWLQKTRGQTPNTVNTTHKNLCCLWRWCRDKGLVFTGPTVKPIRAPRRVPRALSHDEFSRIVAAAYRMTGTIGGLPASVWWVTLLQLCTNTGMRSGELLSLEWQFINWDRGWLIVPAELRKGKYEDGTYALWPETLAWLSQYRKNEGRILGWERDRSRYWDLWNNLLDAAGLPKGRELKTQALRRTFATVVDLNGGDASRALGHADPTMAKKHYIDPSARPAVDESSHIPGEWRPLGIVGPNGEVRRHG